MKSLVLDLQSDALDDATSIAQLLRKARVLSVKLEASDLGEWLGHESSGYPVDAELPEYRMVTGQPKIKNPFHGLQPLIMADDFSAHAISTGRIVQSVAELESLMLGDGTMHMDYPNSIKIMLMKGMTVQLEPILVINRSSIVAILDAVRNGILNWTLELEKRGVLGEGLQFSSADREKAVAATYQITTNIGEMHGSQLQQFSDKSSQAISGNPDIEGLTTVLKGIQESLGSLGLDEKSENELSKNVAGAMIQIESAKPEYSVLEECINSIRATLEAAAGNVLAAGYLHQLGAVLS